MIMYELLLASSARYIKTTTKFGFPIFIKLIICIKFYGNPKYTFKSLYFDLKTLSYPFCIRFRDNLYFIQSSDSIGLVSKNF